MNRPKLSVCVITFNQRRYIRQCLQSLLDQQLDCDFEIIVGDDCSTDGTREIVREIADRHPDIIRVILQEANTHGGKNNRDVHRAAGGEYIAHMDGDDYALPGKLQSQVEFLDQHRDCSMVCHRVQIINADGSRVLGVKPAGRQPTFTDLEGLVKRYVFFVNSSTMYRRSASFLTAEADPPRIDFYSHVERASFGYIGFLPEVLGAYRQTGGGITSATGERLYRLFDLTLEAYERARQLGVRDAVANTAMARYTLAASLLCLERGDLEGYHRLMLASRKSGNRISLGHACIYLLRSHPRVVRFLVRLRRALIASRRRLP